jgi:hypothetical protein
VDGRGDGGDVKDRKFESPDRGRFQEALVKPIKATKTFGIDANRSSAYPDVRHF